MSGDLAAAADILTGAVVAHVVEPDAGRIRHAGGTNCLNCSVELIGAHCHACGQKASVHRTLAAFWHDLAHGVLHIEGKVWHTLPLLFFKPGQLTRRYVHGERARFVSPLALFLFSVFLMFAVFESVGGPIVPTSPDRTGVLKITTTDFARELADAEQTLVRLTADRKKALSDGQSTVEIDKTVKELKSDISGLTFASQMMSGKAIDQLPAGVRVNAGSQALNDHVKAVLRNPKLLFYKLQTSAYKFAWALIPMSVPFMWLIFIRQRQYKLYDHSIFITYSLSFVLLLLVIMALLVAIGVDGAWALILVPVHLFMQLKHAYKISNFGAFWRTCILMNVAVLVLSAFALLLLGMGLTG